MFKLFVLINCDICGEPFEHVALSTDRHPSGWEYVVANLEFSAERRGWDLYHRHWCYSCVEEASSDGASSQPPDDDECPF